MLSMIFLFQTQSFSCHFYGSTFQIWIQHKIFKKMMYNLKFFNFFFGGGPYGDFSDIKSSIRNRMIDFEFFIAIFYLKMQQLLVGGQLISKKSHKSITLIIYRIVCWLMITKIYRFLIDWSPKISLKTNYFNNGSKTINYWIHYLNNILISADSEGVWWNQVGGYSGRKIDYIQTETQEQEKFMIISSTGKSVRGCPTKHWQLANSLKCLLP